MTKVRPITPGDAGSQKKESFPDAVLESFNELIAEKYDGSSARILQKDIVARMIEKGLKSETIFDKDWLDVEGVYESAGWRVSYDKCGFNESYEAGFIFERSR